MVNKGHASKEETKEDQSLEDEFNLPQIPEEEILKYTLQEDLTEAERILVLLGKKDQPSQMSYVFNNAVNIFKGNPDGIQQQVIPVILKQMGSFNEQMQAEVGQAFSQLLTQKIMEPTFFRELRQHTMVMLKQWSRIILKEWIIVYVTLLKLMIANGDNEQKLTNECIETVNQMSSSSQPISVRISSADLLGQMAKAGILSSKVYLEKMFPRVAELCKDRDWEVHAEMCKNLKEVSLLIGKDLTVEVVYPVILGLLSDQEQEVSRKAISSLIKHVTINLIPQAFVQQESFKTAFKRILSIVTSSQCPLQTRNSILSKLGDLFQLLEPAAYGNDNQILEYLLKLIPIARKSEIGRALLPHILGKVTRIYTQNGVFVSNAFQEPLSEYLHSEITSQGITKEIKKAIASQMHTYLITALKSSLIPSFQEQALKTARDIIHKYRMLLLIGNKEIINELVVKVYDVLIFLHDNPQKFPSEILQMIHEYIKEPMFTQTDSIVIQNWRFHLNYYQSFLSKYILISEKDEATMIVFPLMLKGAADPKTSLPVKKFIGEFFADVIAKQANMYLRLSIQESIIKDFAQSESSQLRQVFIFFMEHLLPSISKGYLRQVYLEAFLSLAERDHVTSILLGVVKLIPDIRMKLDDPRCILRLDSVLNSIKNRYSEGIFHKKCTDLLKLTEETIAKVRDPKFIQEVQIYQQTKEKVLAETEHHLRDEEMADKGDQNPQKRKKMEVFIQKLCGEGFKKGIRIMPGPQTPLIINKNPLTKFSGPFGSGNVTPTLVDSKQEEFKKQSTFGQKKTEQLEGASAMKSRNAAGGTMPLHKSATTKK